MGGEQRGKIFSLIAGAVAVAGGTAANEHGFDLAFGGAGGDAGVLGVAHGKGEMVNALMHASKDCAT